MWMYQAPEQGIGVGRSVTAGHVGPIKRATPFAVLQRIPDHPPTEVVLFRYGARMGGINVWHARAEALRTSAAWAHLTRCRAIVELSAYCDTLDGQQVWHAFDGTAYACCLYEGQTSGSFFSISEEGPEGRRPLLTNLEGAMEWLNPAAVPPLGMMPGLTRLSLPVVTGTRRRAELPYGGADKQRCAA